MTLVTSHKILWLAVAGAMGALCRYGLTGLIQKNLYTLFPMGTFFVNLLACFFAGALFTIFQDKLKTPGEIRIILFIGFFGAFSTFSTFMLETTQMLRDGQFIWAMANIILQNTLGIIFMFCGIIIGKFI